MKKFAVVAAMATAFLGSTAYATDLEVTHWWTSGGEAAAVAELAKAFDASGDKWIDGAIAGGVGPRRRGAAVTFAAGRSNAEGADDQEEQDFTHDAP